MIVRGEIKSGLYFDSVTLMIVGRDISAAEGVADAAVVMGTRENKAILRSSGLWLDQFEAAGDTDLLLAVSAESAQAAGAALDKIGEQLKRVRNRGEAAGELQPHSIDAAIRALPGANVALISVAGRYAGDEAMKALKAGLHVMLFSDNVPLEMEIALKEFGRERGLLVMGPDCGTAIINGVPLGFANAVNRGDIGIVAAAGTGLQEVSTILSNEGAGISQAIGTGGRDVKEEVGGIMFLEALRALCDDPATQVILLVSKPPHESVLSKIGEAVKAAGKPVIAAFLGADAESVEGYGMIPAATLEEAALVAVALNQRRDRQEAHARDAGGDARAPLFSPYAASAAGETLALRRAPPAIAATVRQSLEGRDCAILEDARREAVQASPGQKYVRGLFSGGTFCVEAQLVFRQRGISGVWSNVPLPPFGSLADACKSAQHTLVDLGDDVFTVGRPHPMIDFSLRNRRIIDEARDPETALILLDVVLGCGANLDPAGELVPVIREAQQLAGQAGRRLIFACSVTGTPQDPQNRTEVQKALRAAGARVLPSNAAAARFAACVARRLREDGTRMDTEGGASRRLKRGL